MNISEQKIECHNCGFAETIKVQSSEHDAENAAQRKLGFKRLTIRTTWGSWTPLVCERCVHRMDRLDQLRIAIKLEVDRHYTVKAVDLHCVFVEYTEDQVNSEAWKLLEKGLISVDEKGILHKGD